MDRAKKDQLQELMVRLADGDRAAFDPLFETLWPLVRRFAERALAGSPDADDAAQVVLMNVFSRVSEFDRKRGALTWVLGMTAYQCKTLRQKQRRRREAPALSDDRAAGGPSPEEATLARDLEAAVLEVVGTLRPADREALCAVMAGQRPTGSGATFRKRIERALVRLRAAWSSRHGLD